MKRAYTKPILQIEEFIPQEYVATCNRLHTASVRCTRPGQDPTKVDGNAYGIGIEGSIEGQNLSLYGDTKDNPQGYYFHGGCANSQKIYIDGSLTGVEVIGDWVTPITNLVIGDEDTDGIFTKQTVTKTAWSSIKANTTYEATWVSYDRKGSSYTHWGPLTLTGDTNFS